MGQTQAIADGTGTDTVENRQFLRIQTQTFERQIGQRMTQLVFIEDQLLSLRTCEHTCGQRCRCYRKRCPVTEFAQSPAYLIEQLIDTAEQFQTAFYLQQQPITWYRAHDRRELVSPGAQALERLLLGSFVAAEHGQITEDFRRRQWHTHTDSEATRMLVDPCYPKLPPLPFNENAGASIGISGREDVERELLQMNMQP